MSAQLYKISLVVPGPCGAETRQTSTREYAAALEWIDRQLDGTKLLALSVVRMTAEG